MFFSGFHIFEMIARFSNCDFWIPGKNWSWSRFFPEKKILETKIFFGKNIFQIFFGKKKHFPKSKFRKIEKSKYWKIEKISKFPKNIFSEKYFSDGKKFVSKKIRLFFSEHHFCQAHTHPGCLPGSQEWCSGLAISWFSRISGDFGIFTNFPDAQLGCRKCYKFLGANLFFALAIRPRLKERYLDAQKELEGVLGL